MPTQPRWNIFEAAILLQAYIEACQMKISMQEAISKVSIQLRQMAINNNVEIDDIYRNINGITFQIKSMESAYKGYTVIKPASGLFKEIVSIYNNSPNRYREILEEARKMIETRNISQENEFYTWLAERVTPSQLSDFYSLFHEINSFCYSRKIISKPLFLIDDISMIKRVRNTIEQNNVFKFKYKRDIKKMMIAIKYYLEFYEQRDMVPDNGVTVIDNSILQANHTETVRDSNFVIDESSQSEGINNLKNALLEWMKQKGMADATVRSYISAIKKSGEYANEIGLMDDNIFALTRGRDVQELRNKLFSDAKFVQINEHQHNRFNSALVKYEQFFAEINFHKLDTEYENKYPLLYKRLKNASKVYIDPNGLQIEKIKETIGYDGDINDIIDILEHVSWACKIEERCFSFSPRNKGKFEGNISIVEKEPDDFDKELFIKVLMMRFQGGLQFDTVDFENFKETYEMLTDSRLEFSESDLEKRLRYCGVLYKDRLFPAEGIIDKISREKLFEYIENSFSLGNKVLYYKAIFEDLSDVFTYCFSLTDEMMLKAYIEYEAEKGKYYFHQSFMSVEKDVKIDHTAEIKEYLLTAGKPVSFEDIYAGLSHISSDMIYREIQLDPNFLRNEKSHYFHIGIFELSNDEKDKIATYIQKEIEEDGYAIWSRVYVKIQKEMPVFIENNLYRKRKILLRYP